MTWALTAEDGEILAFREQEPVTDQDLIATHKPRWLPVLAVAADYDPATHVLDGWRHVRDGAVVRHEPVIRAKTSDEIAAMRLAKDEEIERHFEALHTSHIEYAGQLWHADSKAVENIMGTALLVLAGLAENPRPWTPVGSDDPVENVNVIELGALIAARRQVLFDIKKAKQKAVGQMTDPAAIAAFDVTGGWA